jgi:hypothetical protein
VPRGQPYTLSGSQPELLVVALASTTSTGQPVNNKKLQDGPKQSVTCQNIEIQSLSLTVTVSLSHFHNRSQELDMSGTATCVHVPYWMLVAAALKQYLDRMTL